MTDTEHWEKGHTVWRRADGYVVFYSHGGMWTAQGPRGHTISDGHRSRWSTPEAAACFIDANFERKETP